MGLAIIFTGQGNQNQSMFTSLTECYTVSDLEQISDDLQIKISPQVELSNEDILANQYAQPLIAAHGLMIYQNLIPHINSEIIGLSGYSLGEITAIGASSKLSLTELISITKKRASLMVTEYPSALVYINGIEIAEINQYLPQYNCYLAIINASNQLIIGGYLSDLMVLIDVLVKLPSYQNHKILGVRVASHTPLLHDAAISYQDYLLNSNLVNQNLNYKVVSGYNALTSYTINDAIIHAAEQMYNTISFNKVIHVLHELGADTILEIGQGTALQKIVKNTGLAINIRSTDDFRSIEQIVQWVDKYTNLA